MKWLCLQHNKLSQSECARKRTSFGGDSLLQTTVATDHISVVVNHIVAGAVELRCEVTFCQGEAHGVRNAL